MDTPQGKAAAYDATVETTAGPTEEEARAEAKRQLKAKRVEQARAQLAAATRAKEKAEGHLAGADQAVQEAQANLERRLTDQEDESAAEVEVAVETEEEDD